VTDCGIDDQGSISGNSKIFSSIGTLANGQQAFSEPEAAHSPPSSAEVRIAWDFNTCNDFYKYLRGGWIPKIVPLHIFCSPNTL
jgi:hypothetical protein